MGFCTVRFPIAIPIALLFLAWRRWKFLAGFVTTAGALALSSVAIVGMRGTVEYIRLLAFLGANSSDQAKLGVIPAAMPNVRGIVYGMGLRETTGLAVVLSISLVIFFLATRREASLPLAIGVATLIGFHNARRRFDATDYSDLSRIGKKGMDGNGCLRRFQFLRVRFIPSCCRAGFFTCLLCRPQPSLFGWD